MPTPADPKKVQLGDKIFGAHNNSTSTNEFRESFDMDSSHRLLEDSYDEEEYLHRKKLEETVYEAFQSSRWYPLSYKKKDSKGSGSPPLSGRVGKAGRNRILVL